MTKKATTREPTIGYGRKLVRTSILRQEIWNNWYQQIQQRELIIQTARRGSKNGLSQPVPTNATLLNTLCCDCCLIEKLLFIPQRDLNIMMRSLWMINYTELMNLVRWQPVTLLIDQCRCIWVEYNWLEQGTVNTN